MVNVGHGAFCAAALVQRLALLFRLTNLIFDEEILYQKSTMQFARRNAQKTPYPTF